MSETDLWVAHDLLQDALGDTRLNREEFAKAVASALAILKANLRPTPSFLPVLADEPDRFEVD